MKKVLLIAGLCFLAFTLVYYWRHPLGAKVVINNHTFYVDVAVTEKQKELGLGNRVSLPKDHGMVFPYDHPEQYTFWMKGMEFPLDMIWIRDKKIIDISKNVPVASGAYLPAYAAKAPVDMVLEVNAGVSDTENIKIGDTVKIVL